MPSDPTVFNFGDQNEQIVKTFILPCSGTAFPIQLGLISCISESYEILRNRNDIPESKKPIQKYEKPNLVLATSGGNLAAYFSLYADWNYKRIKSSVHLIDPETFLSLWTDHTPSWLFLPFSKSVFRPGYGFKDLFNNMFTPASIQETEIWTGTIKKESLKHCVFTNKKCGTTLIQPNGIEGKDGVRLMLGDSHCGIYLEGNIDKIAEVALASASIPFLVRPAKVGCEEHQDGGCMYSSPLSCLSLDLIKLSKPPCNKRMRLFYIQPTCATKPTETMLDFATDISSIIAGLSYMDVRAFLNVLTGIGCKDLDTPDHYEKIDCVKFSEILFGLENSSPNDVWHYGILLYPENSVNCLDFTSVCSASVLKTMEQTKVCFGAFVWKIPSIG